MLGTVTSLALAEHPELPPPVQQAAKALQADIAAVFDDTVEREAANVTTVRLPSTDARSGYLVEVQGPSATRSYLETLTELGIGRGSMRVVYPVLSGKEDRHENYKPLYEWFGSAMDHFGMQDIVEVSMQFDDENFHRGVGVRDQCEGDVAKRFAEYAANVASITRPEFLIIDLKPSTMKTAGRCEAYRDKNTAALLVAGVLESLEVPEGTILGISIDLVRDADFRRTVMSLDGDFFIAVSTIQDDLTVAELRRHLDELTDYGIRTGRKLALNEFWLRKRSLIDGEGLSDTWSSATADLWEIWKPADTALLNAVTSHLGSEWLYVSAYETDLVIGGYVPSGWLADNAVERPVKVRNLSSAKSREIRYSGSTAPTRIARDES